MSNYYRTLLAIGGYSPELQAVINRAILEGFTLPNAETLKKLDVFIKSIVTDNVFSKCDYLRVSAMNDVSTLDFCRINIANPTGTLATIVGGMIYNVYGFKGNKTAPTHLNTGVNLSTTTKYTQNSAARLYVLQSITTNGVAQGFEGILGNTSNQMQNTNTSAQKINQDTYNLPIAVNFTGTGLKAIVRNSSTNVSCYNKNIITTAIRNSQDRINAVQVEFKTNNVYSDTTHSLSMYSSALSDTEVENIRTYFNNYLISIGLTAYA